VRARARRRSQTKPGVDPVPPPHFCSRLSVAFLGSRAAGHTALCCLPSFRHVDAVVPTIWNCVQNGAPKCFSDDLKPGLRSSYFPQQERAAGDARLGWSEFFVCLLSTNDHGATKLPFPTATIFTPLRSVATRSHPKRVLWEALSLTPPLARSRPPVQQRLPHVARSRQTRQVALRGVAH
jgi:hypothetical protein